MAGDGGEGVAEKKLGQKKKRKETRVAMGCVNLHNFFVKFSFATRGGSRSVTEKSPKQQRSITFPRQGGKKLSFLTILTVVEKSRT